MMAMQNFHSVKILNEKIENPYRMVKSDLIEKIVK
jgi:hypothetical protein